LLEEHLALRARVPANPVGPSIQQQGPHKAFGKVELESVHEVVNVLVGDELFTSLEWKREREKADVEKRI
jgi:tRNA G10  N-methylase Trm11